MREERETVGGQERRREGDEIIHSSVNSSSQEECSPSHQDGGDRME